MFYDLSCINNHVITSISYVLSTNISVKHHHGIHVRLGYRLDTKGESKGMIGGTQVIITDKKRNEM